MVKGSTLGHLQYPQRGVSPDVIDSDTVIHKGKIRHLISTFMGLMTSPLGVMNSDPIHREKVKGLSSTVFEPLCPTCDGFT